VKTVLSVLSNLRKQRYSKAAYHGEAAIICLVMMYIQMQHNLVLFPFFFFPFTGFVYMYTVYCSMYICSLSFLFVLFYALLILLSLFQVLFSQVSTRRLC
jgi:hypothetical protein